MSPFVNMKNKIHYAWIILIVCCVIRACAYGMIACPAGLYNSLICADLNIQVGAFSLAHTFSAIAMMITQAFASKIYKKYDMKKVMVVTGIMYFIVSFLMGYGKNVFHWYVLASIQGIMSGFFNGSASSVIICRWFYGKTAFALGLVDAVGFGMGMFMNPILSTVLSNIGWRNSYQLFAAISFVVTVPLLFLIKDNPKKYGMEPYGTIKDSDNKDVTQFKCRYAKNTFLVAAILTVIGTICNASGGYYQHISSYCVYNGLGLMAGSIMSTCELGGVVVLKLLVGPLVDKFGVIKSELILFVSSFVAFLLFIFTNDNIMLLYFAAFVSGIYSATNSVLLPIFAREQFGEEHYQDVVPWFSTGSGIFSALSTTIFGLLYDKFNSYNPMFIGCIIANVISLAAILIAKILEDKKIKKI